MLKPSMKNISTKIEMREEIQKRFLLLAPKYLLSFNKKNLFILRKKNQKELAIKS